MQVISSINTTLLSSGFTPEQVRFPVVLKDMDCSTDSLDRVDSPESPERSDRDDGLLGADL